MTSIATGLEEQAPLLLNCPDTTNETAFHLCSVAWRQLDDLTNALKHLSLEASLISQLNIQVTAFRTFISSELQLLRGYALQQFPKNLCRKVWLRALRELSGDIVRFSESSQRALRLLESTALRIQQLDKRIYDSNFSDDLLFKCLGLKQDLRAILQNPLAGKDGIEGLKTPLQQLALKTDRVQVQLMVEEGDQELLEAWGALRYSRKQATPSLYKTHYAVIHKNKLRILRFIHKEDGFANKGCIDKASTEARVYTLLDEEMRASFVRRRAIGPKQGLTASRVARKLKDLHPNLLCGVPVPPRPRVRFGMAAPAHELIMPRLLTDLEEPIDSGMFRGNIDRTAAVLKEILRALVALHAENWVHGDIKPGNTLMDLSEDQKHLNIKICDFGFAEPVEQGQYLKMKGTPAYLAPDHVNRIPPKGPKGAAKADVFSVAAMAWEMLTGHEIDHMEMWKDAFYEGRVVSYKDLETWGFLSLKEAEQQYGKFGVLIHSMLNPNPNLRPSSEEALHILEELHPGDKTVDEL